MRKTQIVAAACMALIAGACYIHPIPDDFDRYMYEAIVRSKLRGFKSKRRFPHGNVKRVGRGV